MTYQTTRATTMMAATIATMATVDTPPFCLADPAAKLRRERNCPRPRKREAEASEHREVSMERPKVADVVIIGPREDDAVYYEIMARLGRSLGPEHPRPDVG
jgi:hypothetical protein